MYFHARKRPFHLQKCKIRARIRILHFISRKTVLPGARVATHFGTALHKISTQHTPVVYSMMIKKKVATTEMDTSLRWKPAAHCIR